MNKKIIHLQTKEEAEAFMKFLVMEKNRHFRDIIKIEDDLMRLSFRWKIQIPNVPENLWVDVA